MRLLLAVLVSAAFNVSAGEVETDYFTLDLPEGLQAETDESSRLLAFGAEGPYRPPFLIIEFGEELDFGELVSGVNSVLEQFEAESLEEIPCEPDCESLYAEFHREVEGETLHGIYYLSDSEDFDFVLSYLTDEGMESGRALVEDLTSQLLGT